MEIEMKPGKIIAIPSIDEVMAVAESWEKMCHRQIEVNDRYAQQIEQLRRNTSVWHLATEEIKPTKSTLVKVANSKGLVIGYAEWWALRNRWVFDSKTAPDQSNVFAWLEERFPEPPKG